MDIRAGTISRINIGGLLIIRDDKNENQYPATFDKIAGYRGEYPKELKQFSRKGLIPNIKIKFSLIPHEEYPGEKRIEQVMPAD